MKTRKTILAVLALVGIGLISTAAGGAGNPQMATPTFSIDHYSGPTFGAPDAWWGMPIMPDDILTPQIPGPPLGFPNPGMWPPGMAYSSPPSPMGPGLGLMFPGGELDALSYGHDDFSMGRMLPDVWSFSVDRYAAGAPAAAMTPPDVLSEGVTGAIEAAADVHKNWFPGAGNNTIYLDGDGMGPVPWGVNLIEAPGWMPMPGLPIKDDDNLDAVDIDTIPPDVMGGPIYFSLDSAFIDPLEMMLNMGAAVVNGFSGSDVMVSMGGGLGMYAPAPALGLDMAGLDTDDLDALMLVDDGDMQFNAQLDFIAFSVRRGSAVVGMLDSIWNIPISEGDILVPPPVAGGAPGILVRAEWLGLATIRSMTVGPLGFNDDLDALDVRTPLLGDTNDDGVIDIVDLTALAANWFNPAPPWWTSGDFDGNGVIDIVDLTALAANWGMVGDPPPVPEPITLTLLALGGLGLLRRRRF